LTTFGADRNHFSNASLDDSGVTFFISISAIVAGISQFLPGFGVKTKIIFASPLIQSIYLLIELRPSFFSALLRLNGYALSAALLAFPGTFHAGD
jgi:hypothetical protein